MLLYIQNVSDVLSCQAFLSLASAFPSPRYRRGVARLAAVTGEVPLFEAAADGCDCADSREGCAAGDSQCRPGGSKSCSAAGGCERECDGQPAENAHGLVVKEALDVGEDMVSRRGAVCVLRT